MPKISSVDAIWQLIFAVVETDLDTFEKYGGGASNKPSAINVIAASAAL
jgi:hypothetical protein